jgi:hypothetical protein
MNNNAPSLTSNDIFNAKLEGVVKVKKWIRAIQERLRDITALRLSLNARYDYTGVIAKQTGKITGIPIQVCIVDVTSLMEDLHLDNQVTFWRAVLSRFQQVHFFNSESNLLNKNNGNSDVCIPRHEMESLLEKIRRVRNNEEGIDDVLGAFFHRISPKIELYAQLIVTCSIEIDVPAEQLAFVVLTHELAHAYTIAGFDLNGDRSDFLYVPQNVFVAEGIAQYYTEIVCSQMDSILPNISNTFEQLFNHQGLPYTWYRNWGINHERVRSALIRYRENFDLSQDDFEKLL